MRTYNRLPVALVRGRGAVVWDIEGREYIDCVGGIAVNTVGHCHPYVVEAIKKQAEKIIHTSNLYYNELQPVLAKELSERSGMDKFFFCNSGTEAVEASLKLARKKSGKRDIIAARGSFHGRTMGALSVTSNEKYRKPFEPLVPGVKWVDYNDADAIRRSIDENTAAVILEPVQGEGGVNVPSEDYLKEVREICDEKGVLLIFDEVQTGFGRTGDWFASRLFGVKPDIMAMAKGMAGGFPMGAVGAIEDVANAFEPGNHASTFGGNPLACAASLATIRAIEDGDLLRKCREDGKYFIERLREIESSEIKEVRGLGMLIGVEMKGSCSEIVMKMLNSGVLVNCIQERVLRFAPPLVISREQIDEVVMKLGAALS
ncbi:MAG: acetylornithine transaminase [Archaeoglobi archaeon]|nr:acetylornithine transaminase [Candidatus Mnemosynella bozhongmuii]